MSKTIVNTTRRIYWFDQDLILREITKTDDVFYNVQVLEPVNDGQFKNIYITTNNYRTPKKWNGLTPQVEDLGGLSGISVARCRTMEINNNHVIFGNIAKYGSGVEDEGTGVIDEVTGMIDSYSVLIDAFGLTADTGYKRYNKTIIWSNISQPEVYYPQVDNQAGDIDIDEDSGEIVRIKKLQEINVVYKSTSIWLLINVGLPYVFIKKFYSSSTGLLAVNAIVEVSNVHYFVGNDLDIYRFDGVNLVNLSSATSIKDYIKSRIYGGTIPESHAGVDINRKEIYFTFRGKEEVDNPYRDFSIIYNYETSIFSRRDAIAKCFGYFDEGDPGSLFIDDDAETPIDEIDVIIDNYRSQLMIDQSTDPIDSEHAVIDQFEVKGTPRHKLLMGDRDGFLYLFNKGDSFDGDDLYAYYETGDEDYASVSTRSTLVNSLADHSKMITDFLFMLDNQGIDLTLDLYVGTKTGMDGKIYWHGPFIYPQNGILNGRVKLRENGCYHRFKIVSKLKNQFARILGYVIKVEDYGRMIR